MQLRLECVSDGSGRLVRRLAGLAGHGQHTQSACCQLQAQSCLNSHKVAGSVGACAAQQQQLLKPRLSLLCRRASRRCIARSVAVFVAGRALDGPVVHRAVCFRGRSVINPDGSSGKPLVHVKYLYY